MKLLHAIKGGALIAAMTLGLGGAAVAATFSGSFNASFNSSDPGLVVAVDPSSGSGSVNLNVGQSTTFHIFDIYTDETSINNDDTVAKPISVLFDFFTPSVFGTLAGATDGNVAGCLFSLCLSQWGSVEWNNPLNLYFGNGGHLQISLSDATFNSGLFGTFPGPAFGAKVYATMKYVAAPVPLPAGGLLLIGALGGLALLRRKRATHA